MREKNSCPRIASINRTKRLKSTEFSVRAAQILAELSQFFENTRETLLKQRGEHGHWDGELASSALSTATAVIAIDLFIRAEDSRKGSMNSESLQLLVTRGLEWLSKTQNKDGGWGDTILSKSNISTTALVWAAFAGSNEQYSSSIQRCEAWLRQTAGGIEPSILAKAIVKRYGADHTFSVPILTTLVIRNRLGSTVDAWKLVPQLPFELAAFPHQWYARLKLPVVSYALPALIAIGQVKHRHRPSRNPLMRVIRNLTRQRTLRVLQSIQPPSGGFLEATPLTSFVVMSLIGAGNANHVVTGLGIEFLNRSVRDDGSWPIDTNLATWVTTLAVNALGTADTTNCSLPLQESAQILNWLVSQQYRDVHPYTNAAPGGWAWTDLTGGVPDSDDTPGSLLALWWLAGPDAVDSASAGVKWLLDLQNSDGGMPTFCRGWGVLPFDRSSADLTAHALRAWSVWCDLIPKQLQRRIPAAMNRGLRFLAKVQRRDGAWAPLWFGNQHVPTEENLTYGTSRVLIALATISETVLQPSAISPDLNAATMWMISAQNADGGWGGDLGTPSSIEETALAVESLCAVLTKELSKQTTERPSNIENITNSIKTGLRWLAETTQLGREFAPSPIGFYFAKLWYYEKLYPIVYTLAAVGRALSLGKIIPR